MIKLSKQCPFCASMEDYDFDLTYEQIGRWECGELIQNAMPNLNPAEREVFITGMCYTCQSDIFGGD